MPLQLWNVLLVKRREQHGSQFWQNIQLASPGIGIFNEKLIFKEGLHKSLSVIPAKAGIQDNQQAGPRPSPG